MDTSLEVAQLRQEVSLLEHMFQLEKERRIQAERHAEAEKQACVQLQLLLHREQKLRKARASVRKESCSLTQNVGDSFSSQPSQQHTSGSEGNSALSHLEELSSSIFGDLPNDLQEMLDVWAPVGAQPLLSRADEAVMLNDAKGLKACLLSEGGKALSELEKQGLLNIASENGHTACVEVLLNTGCHANVCTRDDGLGPLHVAALHGHTQCAKILLTSGIEAVAASDGEGRIPLFLSLQHGHNECASVLLEAGEEAVLSSVTKSGQTCLHAAVVGHLPQLLRTLLVHIIATFDPPVAADIINHPDGDGTTAIHLAAANGYQDCVQVLCGCREVLTSHRDRWNRTPLDVCAENCIPLLLNRDSKQLTVLVDPEDGLADPDPTAMGHIHLMAHHSWSDLELMVEECLLTYCHLLRGATSSSSSSTPSLHLHPHTHLWTSSLAPQLKRELGGGGEECGHQLLMALHTMQSSTCAMDWNRDSISEYRIGGVRWRAGERSHAMSGKGPLALLTSLKSMPDLATPISEVLITLKGLSQGSLDRLAWDLMVPVATLNQYIQLVDGEKAVIIQGPHGSGKTTIAKSIAEYFKATKQAHIITFSCHHSIKREDLLRLFHLNGLLVEGSRRTDDGSSISSIGSSHHKTQFLILDDLDRLGDTFADLVGILDHRGPDHCQWIDAVCDRDGNVAFSAGEYYLSEGCYIVATRNIAGGEYFVPIADQFAYILLHPSCEPSLGELQRHLRMKLINCCRENMPHRSDKLCRVVQWIWEVWQLYNYLMARLDLPDLVIGPKLFFSCPVEAGDVDKTCSWLSNLWNHRLVPTIEGHLLSRLGTRAVFELLSALAHHVLKPLCPLDLQATNNLFQKFTVGSAGMDQTEPAKASGIQQNGQKSPVVKDVGVVSAPVVKDVGVVTHPAAQNVGVAADSPRTARSSSHATIVSYKDMIRDSPQFRAKKEHKSKKTDDGGSSDTASLASETSSQSGGPTRGRAKTFSLFGRESSFRLHKLFKKNSFRGLDPVKEASKPKKAEVAASSDLHDLYDMISRVGDSRLDEQRSPAPSSMYGSPAPQSSPTPPQATVPRYVLTTSTPQDQHLGHRGNCDQQPDHRGDKVSPLGLSQMATPGRVGSGPTNRWADVEVGTTSCSSISEVTGGRGEEEEGEEPGDAGVPAAAKAGDSLELDLSVSSGSSSHAGLTSWVQIREDEGAAQPHPLPPPPPTGPSTYPTHHHTSLTSDDPHNKSGSSAHSPHPLESQQRRQSKRESWYSDMWDDSNALSFSASLGFEPSSFGKKDHSRFSMSFADQGSEGAEL